MSGAKPYFALFMRELKLAGRTGAGIELGLLFFLTLIAIVPFALGADQKLLSKLAPAILWLGALLASLLGLDRLLQADEDAGVLDQFLLSHASLEILLLVKAFAHWLTTGLPLVLLAPVLGLMLALEPEAMPALILSLLLGTPALTLFGLVGAALTASLRRGGLLLSILVLPLAIPVLIFGVAATQTGFEGQKAAFYYLAAASLFLIVLAPLASAAALRLTRE